MRNWWMSVAESLPSQWKGYKRRWTKSTAAVPHSGTRGAFDGTMCCVVMIWMRDNLEEDALAHEALHATGHLLRQVGIHMDESSEECYTYTLGWIVRRFHEEMDTFFEKARSPV